MLGGRLERFCRGETPELWGRLGFEAIFLGLFVVFRNCGSLPLESRQ